MDRRFVGRGGPADPRINPRHDVQTLAANSFVTTYVGNELRGQFQGPQHIDLADGFGIEGTEFRSDQV